VIKQYYKLRVFLLLTAIILGGTLAVWLSVNLETIIVDYLGKDMSLSGRDQLWAVLIYRGLQRPWLGYGYAGFWNNLREVSIVNALTWLDLKHGGHAHSGFIDLFLQFGFVGLSLFALSCLTVLIRVIQLLFSTQATEYLWLLEFVLITTLSNYSLTSTVLDESNIIWLLYVSTAFSTALWSERIKRNYHRKELHNNLVIKRGTVDNLPNYQ
jgi:O-antigen ligase